MSDSSHHVKDASLHFGLAEQGKLYALDNDHVHALQYYREAMRLAVTNNAPEIFFRHYLECSLESLELLEAYDEVLAYCDKAIDHYQQNPPQHQLTQKDLATIYERKGVILLKKGLMAEAKEALTTAVQLAADTPLPLAQNLINWSVRGYHMSNERILAEQKTHHYFSVRHETTQPDLAIKLSENNFPIGNSGLVK